MAALCGTAFADPATDGKGDQHHWQKPSAEQMAAWHARMCNDMYARKAGKLAYLQAALSITDTQRGAFDQWRDAELSAAKEHSSACLAHTPGEAHEHDALARNAHEEKMLETRLADLKSERPALEALYQSLSPEQKQVFDHSDHGGHHHGHHEMGQRFGERGEHGDGHDRAPG
jgi:hypothetical protein